MEEAQVLEDPPDDQPCAEDQPVTPLAEPPEDQHVSISPAQMFEQKNWGRGGGGHHCIQGLEYQKTKHRIAQKLLGMVSAGKLQRGVIIEISKEFKVSRETVHRIWKKAKEQIHVGGHELAKQLER
ncbi:unnamed protein product [Cuscuta europaea]|uniref:DUF7769 domain-containing protein n=1 Tax=Cuscuta europaea TaxID=41803 RepID=A0A9P1EMW2_CUSEU|nr:unnamed protein product [Cuscuta europaea]